MSRSRKSLFALVALGLTLAGMLTYVGIAYSDPNAPLPLPWDRGRPKPRVLIDRPAESAHWTLQRAYDADQEEHRTQSAYATERITTKPDTETLTLGESDPFAFKWHDSGGPLSLHDFELRSDRSASFVYYRTRSETLDGQRVTAFDHYKADFTLTVAEVAGLRKLLIEARLGTAPKSFAREGIFDGAQWRMELTVHGVLKTTSFSNAFPDEFRAIVVYIWRDICAPRADLIDKAVLVKE